MQVTHSHLGMMALWKEVWLLQPQICHPITFGLTGLDYLDNGKQRNRTQLDYFLTPKSIYCLAIRPFPFFLMYLVLSDIDYPVFVNI